MNSQFNYGDVFLGSFTAVIVAKKLDILHSVHSDELSLIIAIAIPVVTGLLIPICTTIVGNLFKRRK